MSDLFSSITYNGVTVQNFLICTAFSLVIGLAMAFAYSRRTRYTQSFLLTMVVMPSVVQMIIMLVNGNLGTGIAVAGAFTLVRFRSVPGNAKEISAIFMAMAAGFACGTGYVGIASLFALIMCAVMLLAAYTKLGAPRLEEKNLKITIPESLDYSGIFEEILRKYTRSYELVNIKTTNLGSLYKLDYLIVMKEKGKEKEMIDALRCLNGNLEISCGRPVSNEMTL
ncbi:DUF4956 domain-containing protein [Ruminococcus sp. Marseille-P6503]|uniref:DUF4956 domain-containing protein n=1 Tax=Ruminococcus sp. Marseille-P6503 TaxID=2364796 RepID=UPI000F537004|nr:DUF4956 domain-containing protein [Ruminococcus sp. Marseille-P6503]